jgi:hypothetical protein
VSEISSGSLVNLNLFGLGSRNSNDVIEEQDWYLGSASSAGVSDELLVENFVVGQAMEVGDRVSADISTYLKRLLHEQEQSGVLGLQYVALRLSGDNDFGCSSACDSSCKIRRLKISLAETTLSFNASSYINTETGFTKSSHQSRFIQAECQINGGIQLSYVADANGNVIPDFSQVGYRNGAYPIPHSDSDSVSEKVPAVKTLEAVLGEVDATSRIQAAIDEVSALPINSLSGYRGAVVFGEGIFRVAGTLHVVQSGVVLRGSGSDSESFEPEQGTTLLATTTTPMSVLLTIGSSASLSSIESSRVNIVDDYVPVGTTTVHVTNAAGFHVGDTVVIERESTPEWIHAMGMDNIAQCNEPDCFQWGANEYILSYERRITKVHADTHTLHIDVPLMHPIESRFGGGTVHRAEWTGPGRAERIGIEHMKLDSVYVLGEEDSDENHAWKAVELKSVKDAWIYDVSCWHFGSNCVDAGRNSKSITVQECASYDQVSLITGMRRYSFNVDGSQVLVTNCTTRNGRHDYVTGSKVAGPNVFHASSSTKAHADIGPHHRYATGLLFDRISGGDSQVWNRGNMGSGHGWSGAYTVFWNVVAKSIYRNDMKAAVMNVASPPGAMNYGIGGVSDLLKGGGMIESPGLHVFPSSLYEAQLAARLGTPYKECADLQESAMFAPSPAALAIAITSSPSSSSSKARDSSQQNADAAQTAIGATPSSSSSVFPAVVDMVVSGVDDVVVVLTLSIALFVVAVLAVAICMRRRRRCKTAGCKTTISAGNKMKKGLSSANTEEEIVNEDEWKATVDLNTGEEYYFNEQNGRTTWTRPPELGGAPPSVMEVEMVNPSNANIIT